MEAVKLSGVVERFKGDGRKLGYPTANLKVDTELEDGVYFGWANLAGFTDNPALIFIGAPTTLGDRQRRVEAHLLDIPDQDYYEQIMDLTMSYFHRPNQRFNNIDELVVAMKADEAAARLWFTQNQLASQEEVVNT